MLPLIQPDTAPEGFVVAQTMRIASGAVPGGMSWAACAVAGPREVQLAQRRLTAELGFHNLCLLRQVHGTNVVERGGDTEELTVDALPRYAVPPADAQFCAAPAVLLGVVVADCCPVVLCDRSSGLIGIAHAGWRGTASGVAAALVQAMTDAGAAAATLWAWLGVCAEPERYEVGPEVAEQFDPAYSTAGVGDRKLFDLRAALHAQLLACGLAPAAIEQSPLGTIGDPRFHSYRRDGAMSGRMVAVVGRIGHTAAAAAIL